MSSLQKKSGEQDPIITECLTSKPSCSIPWLQRDTTCAVFGGHATLSAGRFAWELAMEAGKASIPPSLKTTFAVADTVIKTVT